MAKQEFTSARIARLAGRIVAARVVSDVYLINIREIRVSGAEIRALAASALTQSRPRLKRKRGSR